jgi:hypothetical protein
VAGADATQRLATSISSVRRSSEHGVDIRGRSPVDCAGADILRTLGMESTFSRGGLTGTRVTHGYAATREAFAKSWWRE